jgi:signal transduction histidine kinase
VPETPPAAKEADAEAKVEEAAAAAEGAKDEPGLKDKLMKAKALAEEQLQEAKGTVDKIKGLFGK